MANGNNRTEEQKQEGAPEWMVTYGDMMTLLLCFFVILVAISEVKEEKFHKVLESIRQYFGYENAAAVQPGEASASSLYEQIRQVQVEMGGPDARGAPVDSTLGTHLRVQTIDEGYKLTIGGKILFEEGQAILKASAYEPLDRLISIIGGYPNKLIVTGHTAQEQVPADAPYEDFWDLAYARAKAAAEYLIDQGIDPRRIRLQSGGPYDRPDSNLTYEGQEANRRVEIVVSEELIPPEGAGGE